MLHRPRPRRTARPAAVAIAGLLAVTGLLPARPAFAAEPAAAAGARHLAETLGGAPSDFALVYERDTAPSDGSAPLWAGKYVDLRSGAVHLVYRDVAAGSVAGPGLRTQALAAVENRRTALEHKGDPELRAAVAAKGGDGGVAEPADATVPVGVWLHVDVSDAEAAVIARHPELTWDGDRPIVGDLATARAIRAELAAARASAQQSAIEQLGRDVAAVGGSVGYASTRAPLVYVDVPADQVEALAGLGAVESLGLERQWSTTMSSAGPGVQANWTSGSADQGAGVRVAVVEYHNVHNTGDLSGKVVASRSTTGSIAYSPTFDHPTWVAGAIAGRSSAFPGVAPGAVIVSSSTGGGSASLSRDRAVIAAADWAAGAGDADVINVSLGQDTATGSEEARRYFDALAALDGRLPVVAAGNFVTFGHWNVLSPGTAYNALTVGGIDDRNTAGRNDDRIWYYPGSNGSSYRDPSGTAWNSHGDFNKPNVSAPAVSVRTANGLGGSGTSVASPIVAGIAAQLIARAPSLALRPEGTRALIMAGAINRSPMPTGGANADHEGTGAASAKWSNRILNAGDGTWGGYRLGTMAAGDVVTQQISVIAGQKVKAVVSWNSHSTSSTSPDRLMADLDLRVVQPNGSVVGSYTIDNNYEWVEFTAARSGTARIEIRQTRFEASSERFGLAWAKWSVGTPVRIAGADRYATSAALSAARFAPGVPVAYVATGTNYPDALAGGPAAGIAGGPVLLTDPGSLPQVTRNELARLRPGRIIVLGGTSAVSARVAGQLEAYGPVNRIQGDNRYETAARVSHATFAPGVDAAFVATGTSFPDALSAGPAAIARGGPVLLTLPGSLPSATRAELVRLAPDTIYVLGGTRALSEGVRQAIAQATGRPVVRLAGADRYATAVAISNQFFGRPTSAYLATGANFPDALSAVPAAGRGGSPLLLVERDRVPPVVASELLRLFPPRTYLSGGTAVIGDAVVTQLRATLGKP